MADITQVSAPLIGCNFTEIAETVLQCREGAGFKYRDGVVSAAATAASMVASKEELVGAVKRVFRAYEIDVNG